MTSGHETLAPGDAAPDCEVELHDGRRLRLSELWAGRTLLLAFTRHLGCTFCRDQLVDLREHYDELRAEEIEVAAVTMADPAEAAAFRDQLRLPFPVVADPQQQVYRAYQTRRGSLLQVFGPAIWLPAVRSLRRAGMGRPRGDLRQLQATFLISAEGRVLLIHHPRNSSDHLPCDRILETCASDPQGTG